MIQNQKKKKYFLYYSLVFIVFAIIIFYPFVKTGYWLINSKDCVKQHFPAFVYLGQYVRGIIKGVISTGKIVIPQWDWNLAYGSSVFTTLNYYSFGDPLNIISVFVPVKYASYAFQMLIIFRLYLAGLAFSCFSWKKQQNKFAILIGTLVYIFSAYGIETSTGHVFFTNVMIYLPIFLLSIEKMVNEKKSGLMIFMTFLSCTSNFYFFYMLSIYVGIYFLMLFYQTYCKKKKKIEIHTFVKEGLRFALAYIEGIGCAAIIFIPILIAMRNSGRGSGGILNLIAYDKMSYAKIFTGSFEYFFGSLNGGYAAIVLLAILALIVKFRENIKIIIGISLIVILQCLPIVGWALNGFTYVTDRWTFIVTFIISYLTILGVSKLEDFTQKKDMIQIGSLLIIYLLFGGIIRTTTPKINNFWSIGIFLIVIIALWIIYIVFDKKTSYKFRIFVLLIMLINITGNTGVYFKKMYKDDFFMNREKFEQALYNSSLPKKCKMHDGEQVDVLGPNILNYSIFNKYGSTSSYWSLGDKGISEYNNLLLNQKMALSNVITGYDSRTVMNTLNSVKYIIVRNPYYENIPYGYRLLKIIYNKKTGFQEKIYKNRFCLKPAYTYDSFITRKEWMKLTPIERENVLSETAVLEKNNNEIAQKTKYVLNKKGNQFTNDFIQKIKRQNKNNKNLIVKKNCFIIKKGKTYVRVPVDGKDRTENYIYFKNFSYQPIKGKKIYDETPMVFWYENKGNYCNYSNQYSRYTTGRKDFLANLGYTKKKGNNIVTIDFRKKGIYRFKKIEFISKELNNYEKNIKRLQENAADSIKVSGNSVFITKKSKHNEILCVNIPYSRGWTAYVNGKKESIERINIMKVGVMLKQGANKITLKYETPGIKVGLIISIVTVICLIVQNIVLSKRREIQ